MLRNIEQEKELSPGKVEKNRLSKCLSPNHHRYCFIIGVASHVSQCPVTYLLAHLREAGVKQIKVKMLIFLLIRTRPKTVTLVWQVCLLLV